MPRIQISKMHLSRGSKALLFVGEIFLGAATGVTAGGIGNSCENAILSDSIRHFFTLSQQWSPGTTKCDIFAGMILLIGLIFALAIGVWGFRKVPPRRWDKTDAGLIGFIAFFLGLMIGGMFLPARA